MTIPVLGYVVTKWSARKMRALLGCVLLLTSFFRPPLSISDVWSISHSLSTIYLCGGHYFALTQPLTPLLVDTIHPNFLTILTFCRFPLFVITHSQSIMPAVIITTFASHRTSEWTTCPSFVLLIIKGRESLLSWLFFCLPPQARRRCQLITPPFCG